MFDINGNFIAVYTDQAIKPIAISLVDEIVAKPDEKQNVV